MTNHPRRSLVAAAKRSAQEAGYAISEGAYLGTTDDRIGRWYVTHQSDETIDRRGAGHTSKGDAWLAAAKEAEADGVRAVSAADGKG